MRSRTIRAIACCLLAGTVGLCASACSDEEAQVVLDEQALAQTSGTDDAVYGAAFYDNNEDDAVCARFASGCCSIVTFAAKENAKGGRRCFIGMLDPSARPLVPRDELTFTIPACRFKEMMNTMEQSALFQKAYSIVRKRINEEI